MKIRMQGRHGYISDQKGIMNRYLREQGAWDPHLLNCRKYIIEGIARNNPSIVTILGSGWMLDVPFEEIAAKGITINLVDVNHPPQVKRKVSKYRNVNLITDDITGGLLYNMPAGGKKAKVSDEIPEYKPSFETGLVISLNILTQLDMLFYEYLVKNKKEDGNTQNATRKAIQQNHITFLSRQKSLIISDVEEDLISESEPVINNKLLFIDFPDGKHSKTWEWQFDTHGFYYSGKRVIFKVKATEI